MFKFASSYVFLAASSSDELSETELEAGLLENAARELTTAQADLAGLADQVVDEESAGSAGSAGSTGSLSSSSSSSELDAELANARVQMQQQQVQQAQGRRKVEFSASAKGRKDKKRRRKKNASKPSGQDGLAALLKEAHSKREARSQMRGPPLPRAPRRKPVKVRKADTNVVSLSLGTLASETDLATGEAIQCSNCAAYFSALSKVETGVGASGGSGGAGGNDDDDDIEGVWECEFCGTANEVEMSPEEVPATPCLDYVVEGAVAGGSGRESNVVMAVDVSGSMCVTTEVQGKLKLKGAARREKELAELRAFGDGSNQFLRGQSRNTTYISRLQCMQAAVETQLEALAKDEPAVHAGIVTFANDVVIVGDGSATEVTVAGDHLDSYDHCLNVGSETGLDTPIADSVKGLVSKVQGLTEEGQTALGPALVTAVGMAARAPGSEVIICTDGKANIGVGSIADNPTEEEEDEVTEFYERVGAYARDAGVTVNVVTINGTDCSVENLGIVSDATGGRVDIVDPLELATNFSAILADPPIATSVEVVLLCHSGLRFREDDATSTNMLRREIGNVSASTDVTFEYSVRPEFIRSLKEGDEPTELPFQVQVHYTKLNGAKCVRVVTQAKSVTRSRAEAEAHADLSVLGLNNVQHAAKYVNQGDYTDARGHTQALNKMMSRLAKDKRSRQQYVSWVRQSEGLDDLVREEQNAEYQAGIFLSDSDDDNEFDAAYGGARAPPTAAKMAKIAKKKKARARKRNDKASAVMYKSKAVSRSAFS